MHLKKDTNEIVSALILVNTLILENTKVAKIFKYQPHGGSDHLLSVQSIKIEKEKCLSYQRVLPSLTG